MNYGFDDIFCISVSHDTEIVLADDIIVPREDLDRELKLKFENDPSFTDVDSWCRANSDSLVDAFEEIDRRYMQQHNMQPPFGIKGGGYFNLNHELYIYYKGMFASFCDVYDELEVIWEKESGHTVEDDGGFMFEAWCTENPDKVLEVLSRKHLLSLTTDKAV